MEVEFLCLINFPYLSVHGVWIWLSYGWSSSLTEVVVSNGQKRLPGRSCLYWLSHFGITTWLIFSNLILHLVYFWETAEAIEIDFFFCAYDKEDFMNQSLMKDLTETSNVSSFTSSFFKRDLSKEVKVTNLAIRTDWHPCLHIVFLRCVT